MRKRFLATIGLAAALLFTQAGNFLVGALCPHRSGMTSCMTQLAVPTMSHEDMGHQSMGHEAMAQEAATNEDSGAVAAGQPADPCSHCAVHSPTIPNTAALCETDTGKRSVDLNIALHSSKSAPVTVPPTGILAARAHGPPGETTPRHILINIFRI